MSASVVLSGIGVVHSNTTAPRVPDKSGSRRESGISNVSD